MRMDPHRLIRILRRVACGLPVLLPVLLAARIAGAGTGTAIARPSDGVTVTGSPRLAALSADSPEKKRVPKPPPERPRYKPDSSSTGSYSSSESDDDSPWVNCLADCIGNFIGAVCSGMLESMRASHSNPASQADLPWSVGDRAVLHGTTLADSVVLWERPGAGGERGAELERVPSGRTVVVVEKQTHGDQTWLRVRPADRIDPAGWVPASSVVSPAWASRPAPKRPTSGVRISLGGGGVGPSELNTEYRGGLVQLQAQYLRFRSNGLQWSAGLGWRDGYGSPQVLYLTPATAEEPEHSRLDLFDVGVSGGRRYGAASGMRFDWLVGPRLVYVHESTDLNIRDLTSGALLPRRHERLGRWTAGGDLQLNLGWASAGGTEISLLADGYLLSWHGHQERSLSTDFTTRPIHGFDVALAITLPVR